MTRARRLGRATFSSLRNRNYRLYFIGQIISVSGTWMQRVAQHDRAKRDRARNERPSGQFFHGIFFRARGVRSPREQAG